MLSTPQSASMAMHTVPQSTLILSAIALLTLAVGVVRGEPAFGAIGALSLLAWAYHSHCLARATWGPHEPAACDEPEHFRVRAENAGTHLLDVFDAFAQTASPAAQAAFHREFEREQAAWQARGRTMPHYVVIALLRRAEAADREGCQPQDGYRA